MLFFTVLVHTSLVWWDVVCLAACTYLQWTGLPMNQRTHQPNYNSYKSSSGKSPATAFASFTAFCNVVVEKKTQEVSSIESLCLELHFTKESNLKNMSLRMHEYLKQEDKERQAAQDKKQEDKERQAAQAKWFVSVLPFLLPPCWSPLPPFRSSGVLFCCPLVGVFLAGLEALCHLWRAITDVGDRQILGGRSWVLGRGTPQHHGHTWIWVLAPHSVAVVLGTSKQNLCLLDREHLLQGIATISVQVWMDHRD